MHSELIIIGAGGHGKVVADIAEQLHRYETIIFLDDSATEKECIGYPIVGTRTCISEYIGKAEFFVAIGSAGTRERVMHKLKEMQADIATLIHPSAVVSKHAKIGEGTVVMAGAVINPSTTIGEGCIVNTCASVDHDCEIGDYVHIAVGAHLCGTVKVDKSTWVGAGATVKNNVAICGGCMIGAGAVVIRDIKGTGTYMGVPAGKRR